MSRSVIKQLLTQSPHHAWFNHPRLNPDYQPEESETKFDIGTAAHALLLQGLDCAVVIDADDWRKKDAKEARDAARSIGKIPLLKHQWADVEKMVETANIALGTSELCINIWHDGDSELTYIWKEGETWCKARPDWISMDRALIIDYKSTGASAAPEDYVRIAVSTGLDIQDSWYRRGVRAIDGTDPDFIFMVQENFPPYLCSFIRLDMMFQDMGYEKVKKGLSTWRKCMESNDWPGYSTDIYTLEVPPWALASWELRKGAL